MRSPVEYTTGPTELKLRELRVADLALLLRAAAIDSAAQRLIAQAEQAQVPLVRRNSRSKHGGALPAAPPSWPRKTPHLVNEPGATLSFDNMRDRPIKGTHPWQRYGVVLDVAQASLEVAFGVLLAGQGRVWVDDFEFEEVADDVPTTDLLGGVPELPVPMNLDFEDMD